jgi:hypothetical protein
MRASRPRAEHLEGMSVPMQAGDSMTARPHLTHRAGNARSLNIDTARSVNIEKETFHATYLRLVCRSVADRGLLEERQRRDGDATRRHVHNA